MRFPISPISLRKHAFRVRRAREIDAAEKAMLRRKPFPQHVNPPRGRLLLAVFEFPMATINRVQPEDVAEITRAEVHHHERARARARLMLIAPLVGEQKPGATECGLITLLP